MQCKFCGAELEENSTLCPECGKDNYEQTEAPDADAEKDARIDALEKKLKRSKMIMMIAMGLALVVLAVVLVLTVFDGRDLPVPEATTVGTIPPDGNPDDETCKGSYTVSDDILKAEAGTVVATLGEDVLTVEMLQVYYWSTVREYVSGSAASVIDLKQPLDTQICTRVKDKTVTWQQYFLTQALDTWHTYTAVVQKARADGYKLSEVYQTYLDELQTKLEKSAKEGGFESVDALLKYDLGNLATFELYYSYLESYYLGYDYYTYLGENMEVSQEEIEEYFNTNEQMLGYYGVTKDSGKYVDVRHILIMPEGGTTNSSGGKVYSDAEWAACKAKAEQIYNQWKSEGMGEDKFAELAKKHSGCGSASNGGLLDTFGPGEMVAEFEDWSINMEHEYGDHGLIKSSYGYHIMFYVGGDELWIMTSAEGVRSEKLNVWLDETLEANSLKVSYKDIILSNVSLA